MGKRLLRFQAEEALLKAPELVNRELNFILKNGCVFFGILKRTENDIFYCQNMLKKAFEIKSKDIREIILDMTSKF